MAKAKAKVKARLTRVVAIEYLLDLSQYNICWIYRNTVFAGSIAIQYLLDLSQYSICWIYRNTIFAGSIASISNAGLTKSLGSVVQGL